MTSSKTDRRPERSRGALMGAFIDLILERGYEAVTVADVVERANVGRSTLYAHFGGLEGMLAESLSRLSTRLVLLVDRPADARALVPLLEHFRSQRKRNGAFFRPPLSDLWVRQLAKMIEPRLIAAAKIEGRAPMLPWSLVAAQAAEAQVALVHNWLTRYAATPPETIAVALIALTHATIDGLCLTAPEAGQSDHGSA